MPVRRPREAPLSQRRAQALSQPLPRLGRLQKMAVPRFLGLEELRRLRLGPGLSRRLGAWLRR